MNEAVFPLVCLCCAAPQHLKEPQTGRLHRHEPLAREQTGCDQAVAAPHSTAAAKLANS